MSAHEKISVVSGGGTGIGRAICLRLAQEGSTVIIADISEQREETADLIRKQGGRAFAVLTDVSSESSVRDLSKFILEEFGHVDNLINNSGIVGAQGHIDEISLQDWNTSLAINLTGAFLLCRELLPGLKVHGGSIVNIASVAAKRPMRCRSPYSTSKAALIGFTRCLAVDLGPFGIRANSICPGRVEGPRIEKTMHHAASVAGMSYEEYVQKSKNEAPLCTFISPDDVARGVAYLCSEDARHITGIDLNINAGTYMD